MTIHPTPCDCGAWVCDIRKDGGIQFTPSATGNHNRKPPRKHTNNAWERGIAGEHRVGGGFMPYLDKHGAQIGIKDGSEQRHVHKEIRARQRAREVHNT